jgi:colicin import membrane protein
MTAQSPKAFVLSVLLHAAVVVLILLLAYVANESREAPPKILQLVAGAGDNYGATVAAALGTRDGISVSIPTPPAPVPEKAPAPAPAPVEPIAPAPVPMVEKSPVAVAPEPAVKKTPAPTAAATGPAGTEKPPNFVQDVKRIASKRAARLEATYRAQAEAERQRQLKADQAAAKIKHIDTAGIREGLAGGSTENKTGGANGTAMTREEGDLTESYFEYLKAKLKDNHEKPPGLSDKLAARVEFAVAADGTISRVKIIRSSRSPEFDQSVLEAFARTKSIGPRPDHRSDVKELEFTMREENAN